MKRRCAPQRRLLGAALSCERGEGIGIFRGVARGGLLLAAMRWRSSALSK
jgi:hypothetical protein